MSDMFEVQASAVNQAEDVREDGKNAAEWQMDVAEFNNNGCLCNGN